jgi:hypothetical protein
VPQHSGGGGAGGVGFNVIAVNEEDDQEGYSRRKRKTQLFPPSSLKSNQYCLVGFC